MLLSPNKYFLNPCFFPQPLRLFRHIPVNTGSFLINPTTKYTQLIHPGTFEPENTNP